MGVKVRSSALRMSGPTAVVMAICDHLFLHEDQFIDRQINELTDRLGQAMHRRLHGFFFMGRRWIPSKNTQIAQHVGAASLDVPVVPEAMLAPFVEFQKSVDELTRDKQEIRQTLSTVVSRCQDLQELRDALPESLAGLLPKIIKEFQGMNRTREPLWNMSKAHQEQFMLVMPRIDAYLISKMML